MGPGTRRAFVFLVPGRSERRVAALTVLDRLLVALHRAGFREITVVGPGPLPAVARAEAWGIRFARATTLPESGEPWLGVRAEVLVQARDLVRFVTEPGRLADATGDRLPVGVVRGVTEEGEPAWEGEPVRRAEGVARWVRDDGEAREAAKVLWASLTSASDGWVDRVFNRPVGRPLARWLCRTPVTPNQISLASILVGVLSGVMFGLGRYEWVVTAGIVFQLSAILDCVDGDVARVVFKESPLGKWLDLVGDQVVHVSVFVGIAVGLWNVGAKAPVGWLGAAAVAGALLSFVMVLRGMKLAKRTGDDGTLSRWLDAATSRDFSVLVLMLACVELLEVFLWLAAIGSHAFWVLLWWVQGRRNSLARGAS